MKDKFCPIKLLNSGEEATELSFLLPSFFFYTYVLYSTLINYRISVVVLYAYHCISIIIVNYLLLYFKIKMQNLGLLNNFKIVTIQNECPPHYFR